MFYDFIGLLEEDENTYSWFQQYGATAHTANNSMRLTNEIFGEPVISRNLWPPSLVGSYCTRLLTVGSSKITTSYLFWVGKR
jgi:hypothetical protein